MRKVTLVARLLLGMVFLVFGLDGLFHFFPLPPMPPPAASFIHTLVEVKLFYAVKAIELGAAVLLLWGRYLRLALCLLAPIVFNILWFDAVLDPNSLPVAVALLALVATLFWSEREALRPLFRPAS